MVEQRSIRHRRQVRDLRRLQNGGPEEPLLEEHRLLHVHGAEDHQVWRGECPLDARRVVRRKQGRADDYEIQPRDERQQGSDPDEQHPPHRPPPPSAMTTLPSFLVGLRAPGRADDPVP